MKKISKIFCIFLSVALLAGIFAGCGGKDKQEIYFLNFKPEAADIYREIAEEYENKTGVKVKVVTAAANTYEQTLKSEIAKSEAPTIFQINGPVGYNSWKNYCANLKDSKLYDILADKSLAVADGDGVYGIPFVVEGYGIIYNRKILDKYFALDARATKITSVEQIDSFEEFKAVVEDMTKHKAALGIDGVFGSTSLATGEDWRWQTHLSNIPLYAEFSENSDSAAVDMLNSKEITFKYSDNFRKLFDLYTNNSITDKKLLSSKSVADSMAEFALGKVAMIQNGTWAWNQIDDIEGNTVDEKDIGIMPLYMDLENEEKQGLCVGTENFIAVNSNVSEEKQKLSLDFLEWLYTSAEGKEYVSDELGFITPFTTFSVDEVPDDPLSRQVNEWLAKPGVKTIPWVFTGYPSEKFKTDFGAALLEYVQGDETFEGVKSRVIKSWKEERK